MTLSGDSVRPLDRSGISALPLRQTKGQDKKV